MGETSDVALGRQVTVEYYDCDSEVLSHSAALENIFLAGARAGHATVISSHFHDFSPQGVSGVVIIAESHLAVHAWPEHDYAAVDIFTCGDRIDFQAVMDSLKSGMRAGSMIVSSMMNRGIVGNNGVERLVPVCEDRTGRYALSWRRRYEDTGALGLSASIDLYNADFAVLRDDAMIEEIFDGLVERLDFAPGGVTTRTEFGESGGRRGVNLYRQSRCGTIAARLLFDTGTAYFDLGKCGFFEPRDAAEYLMEALSASHYRLQAAVRQ